MEHLNKVELIGRVGSVNTNQVGDQQITRFSLLVNTAYNGAEPLIFSDWFSCSFWGDPSKIQKGNDIHIEGRLHSQSYTDAEGNERRTLEVKVHKIL